MAWIGRARGALAGLFVSLLGASAAAQPIVSNGGMVLGDELALPPSAALWMDASGIAITAQGCFDVSQSPAVAAGVSFDLTGHVRVASPDGLAVLDEGALELKALDCATGLGTPVAIDPSGALAGNDELDLHDPTPAAPDGTVYLRVWRRSADDSHELLAFDPGSGAVSVALTAADLDALLLDELRAFRHPLVSLAEFVESADVPLRVWRIPGAAVAPNGHLWMVVAWQEVTGKGLNAKWVWVVERELDGTLHRRLGPERLSFHPSHFADLGLNVSVDGRFQLPLVFDHTLDALVFGWPTVRGSNDTDEQLDVKSLGVIPWAAADAASFATLPPFIGVPDTHTMIQGAFAGPLTGASAGPTMVGQRPLGFDFDRLDADRDGLSWNQEQAAGTSDLATDFDGDGANDGAELRLLARDPTVADGGDSPTQVWAPSTFIEDWARLWDVDPVKGDSVGPLWLRQASYHQPIVCPRGNKRRFLADVSEDGAGPLCLDGDGAPALPEPPQGHPWRDGVPDSAVFSPSGKYVFAFDDDAEALVRVDTSDWSVHELLSLNEISVVPLPLSDDTLLLRRFGGRVERIRVGEAPFAVVDPDRDACVVQASATAPCEALHPRYSLVIDTHVLGFDATRDRYLFEIRGRPAALTIAVGEDSVDMVLDRRLLPDRGAPGRIVNRPGGPFLVASGGVLGADYAPTDLPQPYANPNQKRSAMSAWYRRGFVETAQKSGYVAANSGGANCDPTLPFGCSGGGLGPPAAFNPILRTFSAEWVPMDPHRLQAGEMIMFALSDDRTNHPSTYQQPWEQEGRLWRIGVEGGTLPWLDATQFWLLMDDDDRAAVDAAPLGELRDLGVAPDLSEVCLVEPDRDRLWRMRLEDGLPTLIEQVPVDGKPGGCAYDDAGRLGVSSATGFTIDGEPSAVGALETAGPVAFVAGTWVVLEAEGDAPAYDTKWRPAHCVDGAGTVTQTPAPIVALGTAPGGAVWIQGDALDGSADNPLLANEQASRALVGDIDALCRGDGAAATLVATSRPWNGLPGEARSDRSLWDWWYVQRANLVDANSPPVVTDGASIAMRDDGIAFVAPIRVHGAGGDDFDTSDPTPDSFFRLRGEFMPLDPARPLEAVQAFRRPYPRMRIHHYRPYDVRAIERVPGGVHADDYAYLGMTPPDLSVVDPTDEPTHGDGPGADDGGCGCTLPGRPAPHGPWATLLFGLLAWRRRRSFLVD